MSSPSNSSPVLGPCAAGIDSLYLSLYIDALGVDWEGLRYEKEKLAATPAAEFAEVKLGGETFALKRGGRKPYSFILKNRAFELQLGERIQPRCHVQISSEALWQLGLEGAWQRLNALWQAHGVRLFRPEVVSRVDAAFDFAIGVPDFQTDHFLSRASKDCTWRQAGELQSLQLGKGDVVFRAYDKVAEIEQQSEKTWLFDIWGTREGVWRFEFQLRGQVLKDAGIETIAQLQAYLPSLVRELAKSHTSLRIPGSDSNRSRWPRHPLWAALIDSADALTSPPDHPPPPLKRGSLYSIERQLQSLTGDLKGLAATLSRNSPDKPVTLPQLMQWLPRMMARRVPPQIWEADVKAKLRKRELGL